MQAQTDYVKAIAADEALWDEQFAATSDDKLAALVQAVEEDMLRHAERSEASALARMGGADPSLCEG